MVPDWLAGERSADRTRLHANSLMPTTGSIQGSGESIARRAIARLRPNKQDDHGHLVHGQGGGWAFHYDTGANKPDEVGFHFADERFVSGEYASINEGGKMHTYRVASVSHL